MCLFLCQYHAVWILRPYNTVWHWVARFLQLCSFSRSLSLFRASWFHRPFWNTCTSSVKYVISVLVRIALNVQIALGSMDILLIRFFLSRHTVCAPTNLPQFLSSVPYSFLSTGLLHPWSDLFLGILLFLKQLWGAYFLDIYLILMWEAKSSCSCVTSLML